MKYYVVIDTNVVVSAMLKADSIPGLVVQFALDGLLIPVLNDVIVSEYRDVLARPKFGFSKRQIDDAISQLELHGVYVDAKQTDIELPDPNDAVFYEVVMEARADEDAYLVTGNIRHFPSKPYIVTPRQMIDIILSSDE